MSWISRSRTRYAIERQIAFYEHRVAPYDTVSAGPILVSAVEDITESEGPAWEAERRSLSPSGAQAHLNNPTQ